MKRTISVMACLAVFCTSQLVALSVATITTKDLGTLANSIDAIEDSLALIDPAEKKDVLLLIPSVELVLEKDETKGILKVSLKGEQTQNLEWVIFKPKGEVISRLSTQSKINEIKISNLEGGDYVLMIKDEEGRALFRNFEKA